MMIRRLIILCCLTFISLLKSNSQPDWIKKELKGFDLYYTEADKNLVPDFESYLYAGEKTVTTFFKKPFRQKIAVYIFPNRSTLDKQWRKVWGDTTFTSQCWMVAAGVAKRMDVLSPNTWNSESCEHNANDKNELQKIITHELTHCFHGQYNPSADFSATENMDWFIEGLATYVSGQLDKDRISQVKALAAQNKLPMELKNIWTGKAKYGAAGSLVKYIETSFGQESIIELLNYTHSNKALAYLRVSEQDLLLGWKNYLGKI